MIRGTLMEVPGDPKKSIPLFGVLGGTQVFAKQQNRHIFVQQSGNNKLLYTLIWLSKILTGQEFGSQI